MKMSDLVRKTGENKETIRFYIREGLLPRPTKLGRNQADYSEEFVECLALIRELQDNYYLPLPIIKKIITQSEQPTELFSLIQLKRDRLKPTDRLLPRQIRGGGVSQGDGPQAGPPAGFRGMGFDYPRRKKRG